MLINIHFFCTALLSKSFSKLLRLKTEHSFSLKKQEILLLNNALKATEEPYSNTIIESFCKSTDRVFIAGDILNKKDLPLVADLANKHRDTKFIIIPHVISEEILNEIKYNIKGYCILYSECDENTCYADKQVLVIDFLGTLSHIYRYGAWAYIGGGFTSHPHSVMEASVYGLPISFGPHSIIDPVAKQLKVLGIATPIRNANGLKKWFVELKDNKIKLAEIKKIALSFAKQIQNAADNVDSNHNKI